MFDSAGQINPLPPQMADVEPGSRHELLKEVFDFYHLAFKETPDAREYLSSRGIVDVSMGSRYQVGWCRGTLKRSMPKADPRVKDFKSIGILTPSGREFFSGCVVFPLLNTSGHVVNLYGRKISDGRVNHLYLPGPKVGIFNVQAIKSGLEKGFEDDVSQFVVPV